MRRKRPSPIRQKPRVALIVETALASGLMTSPSGMSAIVVLPIAGFLLGRRLDARWLIAVGLLVVAAANFWMAQTNLMKRFGTPPSLLVQSTPLGRVESHQLIGIFGRCEKPPILDAQIPEQPALRSVTTAASGASL